jgi:hypothetical protein
LLRGDNPGENRVFFAEMVIKNFCCSQEMLSKSDVNHTGWSHICCAWEEADEGKSF